MKKEWNARAARPVAIWLFVGVFMIIVQVILGGITRLTDSGLSITEWKSLLGTIPPTTDAKWNEAFSRYKQIAQFKQLHSYFTLADFKSIFFWEWLHRVWGRLIGVVFAIPFLIFLVQNRFSKAMINPLLILFLLGALQGVIGWVMVKSGLNDEDLYVSHIRLAVHFITALGLLVYTYWFALQLSVYDQLPIQKPSIKLLSWIIGILLVQLIYGAFMAGLKAAMIAPTWPEINGSYLPNLTSYAGNRYPVLSALVNNPVAVQVIHRNLAYLIFFLIVVWSIKATKERGSIFFNTIKWVPLVLVIVQVGLGIAALLTSVKKMPQRWGAFEWTAQTHQFVALLLLLSLISILFLYTKGNSAAAP